jgi:tetratricopeptide (TPR) repeat protein
MTRAVKSGESQVTRKEHDVNRARPATLGAACLCLLFLLHGCGGNEPKLVANQPVAANSNSQGNNPAQTAAPSKSTPGAPGKVSMGEAIDTSAYDAKIKQLEEEVKKKPKDAGLSKQLAHAYLERGNALTQARQYQAALGDYRRTLKLDPKNEEASYWSQTIIGIMQQMNREVPAEGAEPTPIRQ